MANKGPRLTNRPITGLIKVEGDWYKGRCIQCNTIYKTKFPEQEMCLICEEIYNPNWYKERYSPGQDKGYKFKHKCFTSLNRKGLGLYQNQGPSKRRMVASCVEQDDGRLEFLSGGTTTLVNICPFCGYQAKNKVIFTED